MSGHERERLSAYLDRELAPDEHAAVEAHLSACPECAAFLAELAAVDEAVASLPAEAPEGYFEAFPARVRARLEPRKTAPRGRRVPAWTWAAAAALLLAVVTPPTLRQLRPAPGEAPATAPAALPPAPATAEPTRADEARRPEPSAKASLGSRPPAAQAFGLPAPEPPGAVDVAVATRPAPEAARPFPKDEAVAESRFAGEPAAASRAPASTAPVTLADAESAPAPGGAAREPATGREKGVRERRHTSAAEATAESVSPAQSAGKANAAVENLPEAEESFRRLEAVRPRSAAEWRRLRDEWNALAATEPDRHRADEARVRAIMAGHAAWLASGSADDETAFRRDVADYLERPDAVQKDRVKRLLPEPRQP
jgi:hypothetical protein